MSWSLPAFRVVEAYFVIASNLGRVSVRHVRLAVVGDDGTASRTFQSEVNLKISCLATVDHLYTTEQLASDDPT